MMLLNFQYTPKWGYLSESGVSSSRPSTSTRHDICYACRGRLDAVILRQKYLDSMDAPRSPSPFELVSQRVRGQGLLVLECR